MTGHWFPFAPAMSTLAVVAAATLLTAPPAAARTQTQAMDSHLQLSSDGVNYGRSLPGPVFGRISGYVPGSTSSADIWVRNDAGDSAFLSVAALVVAADAEMATHLGLRIDSDLGSTARTPLAGSCSDLAVGWAVAAGESVRLTLNLDLDPSAPNATRRQRTEIAFRFLLEDQDGSTRRGACASGGGTVTPGLPDSAHPAAAPMGSLASTGTSDPLRWLAAALGAVAAGTGLVVFGRRQKAGAHDED